jgi:hypothetical protein
MTDFSGRYTRDELLRCDAVVRKAFGLPGTYDNVGCFGLIALVTIPLTVMALMRGDESASLQWFLVAGTCAAVALWQLRAMKRSTSKHPFFEQTVSGSIDEQGFRMQAPGSDSTRSWSTFASTYATKDYLLLVGGTNELFGLSRSFFASETEFQAACALAQQNVKGVPPGRTSYKRAMKLATWIVVIIFILLLWNLFRTAPSVPR